MKKAISLVILLALLLFVVKVANPDTREWMPGPIGKPATVFSR